VTLSHKCCRGTVHKSLLQVGYWSNVSCTAAAAAAAQLGLCSVVLKKRIEQQRLQIAPECQIWRQRCVCGITAVKMHGLRIRIFRFPHFNSLFAHTEYTFNMAAVTIVDGMMRSLSPRRKPARARAYCGSRWRVVALNHANSLPDSVTSRSTSRPSCTEPPE